MHLSFPYFLVLTTLPGSKQKVLGFAEVTVSAWLADGSAKTASAQIMAVAIDFFIFSHFL
jgi:hypothetical protein